MIEVEKKFTPTAEQQEALLEGAEFVSKKTMHDRYYDRGYELSVKSFWLRNRDGRWELKVPMREMNGKRNSVELYDELEDDASIITKLDLPLSELTDEAMAKEGYVPYAEYQTTRETYTKEGFTITIDSTSFGYDQCEIELLIEDAGKAEAAADRIIVFATEQGLDTGFTLGKVEMYLKGHDMDRYLAMQEAGVFPKEV